MVVAGKIMFGADVYFHPLLREKNERTTKLVTKSL